METKLVLYTTETCGKCMLVKGILNAKQIEFNIIDDIEVIQTKLDEMGMTEIPLLSILSESGEVVYSGTDAVVYVKETL